jgi:hypothetical protein
VEEGALERSDLVYELACGHRVVLTENRRSDPPLFDFYCGMRVGTPEAAELRDALAEARRLFPATGGLADHYLTIMHRTRKEINKRMNLKLKPADAVLYEYSGDDEKQQSMYLWPGMLLVGSGGKCKKGVFYTVLAVTPEELSLECRRKGEDGEELTDEHQLTQAWAIKSLRPAWAINYAGCQGLTLRGRVRLLETDHPHFVLKHLYVGSSRATAASLLEVA